MDARTIRCDCGALVPVEDGPTHAYMRSVPACWRMFGEVSAARYATGAPDASLVDCYAVQHPSGAATDRRQRQSVAVHLVALCLHGRGIRGRALSTARQRTSERVLGRLGMDDWPFLEPPAERGPVTAADLWRAGADADRLAAAWPGACWTAWSTHHAVVERWADALGER